MRVCRNRGSQKGVQSNSKLSDDLHNSAWHKKMCKSRKTHHKDQRCKDEGNRCDFQKALQVKFLLKAVKGKLHFPRGVGADISYSRIRCSRQLQKLQSNRLGRCDDLHVYVCMHLHAKFKVNLSFKMYVLTSS